MTSPAAQFSKDHGKSILGSGIAVLGLSIAFAAQGVFSRFDRIENIADTANKTVQNVQIVSEDLTEKFKILNKNIPTFGTNGGEAAGNAVNKAQEVINGATKDGEKDGFRGWATDRLKKGQTNTPK